MIGLCQECFKKEGRQPRALPLVGCRCLHISFCLNCGFIVTDEAGLKIIEIPKEKDPTSDSPASYFEICELAMGPLEKKNRSLWKSLRFAKAYGSTGGVVIAVPQIHDESVEMSYEKFLEDFPKMKVFVVDALGK